MWLFPLVFFSWLSVCLRPSHESLFADSNCTSGISPLTDGSLLLDKDVLSSTLRGGVLLGECRCLLRVLLRLGGEVLSLSLELFATLPFEALRWSLFRDVPPDVRPLGLLGLPARAPLRTLGWCLLLLIGSKSLDFCLTASSACNCFPVSPVDDPLLFRGHCAGVALPVWCSSRPHHL